MAEMSTWHGVDLDARRARITRAFALAEVEHPDDLPILITTTPYFAFGSNNVPADYFTNPAVMLRYQESGHAEHMARVPDDYVPYLMPWYGTGVLASAFGCRIALPSKPGEDPAVAAPCVNTVADAARLRLPDPRRDGQMPLVLETIDYFRAHSDLPVSLTDMQGPLDTIGLIVGQELLYQWMYQDPRLVHELFDLVTEAFIQWVKVQKQHCGQADDQNSGLIMVWSPKGVGIWESDDDLVLVSSKLYQEFVVPSVSRIFTEFGGGTIHFCGSGVHQVENFRQVDGLRALNVSPMGNFEIIRALQEQIGNRVTIQVQEIAPLDIDNYVNRLFTEIKTLRGLILAPMALPNVALAADGSNLPTDRDPTATAQRLLSRCRENAAKFLAGEVIQITHSSAVPAARPATVQQPAPAVSPDERLAIEAVIQQMLSFDGPGVQAAVVRALDVGLPPFAIITLGLADAMQRVGARFECGEYFLPELIMAGSAMKAGLSVLQPLLSSSEHALEGQQAKIVIGTVKGDLHDIGKNIVKTLFEAGGFQVHDIGVDQPVKNFVTKAREVGADIVAMSALLTTSMVQMRATIEALRAAGVSAAVMVGGAPISREFATQIGADGYAPDAVKAVAEARRLVGRLKQNT